ncbi:unnamed protein product, partial [Tetraodon nigroviridis]
AYTNHTVLPEALERWPIDLFKTLLPRHLDIIYEINRRHLEIVSSHLCRALYDAVVASSVFHFVMSRGRSMGRTWDQRQHAPPHTPNNERQLFDACAFKDFYDIVPEKFQNKTNGITPRRWLVMCNPGLAEVIAE